MHLMENDVHIWNVDISHVDPALVSLYRSIMSAEELERNQRYRFEKNRFSDCVTRALVRDVLSKYADKNPKSWRFAKGEHGKPEVVDAPVPLRFNLSHTSDHIVCVVTPNHNVGIDIEHTARKNDVLAIANRFFSKREVIDLFKLPIEQQSDRFFDYWTLKEAYMKARGEGISLGLSNFGFSVANKPDITIEMNSCLNDSPLDWQFFCVTPNPDYRLSLAFNSSKKSTVACYDCIPLESHTPIENILF